MSLAPLESLPPELGLMILSHLNSQSLTALTRASPTYWALYIVDRPRLLSTLVHIVFGPSLSDALGVVDASRRGTLDDLARCPALPGSSYIKLSVRQALRVLHVHTIHVEPLVREFGQWSLGELERLAGVGLPSPTDRRSPNVPRTSAQTHQQERERQQIMSKEEEIRIARAFYHLLYLARVERNQTRTAFDPDHSPGKTLIRAFAPWEWEAMRCLETFFRSPPGEAFSDQLLRHSCACRCFSGWWGFLATFAGTEGDEGEYGPGAEEEEPLAWGWKDWRVLYTSEEEQDYERLSMWRRIGYVLWDDDRMMRWARRMGLEEMKSMGFVVDKRFFRASC